MKGDRLKLARGAKAEVTQCWRPDEPDQPHDFGDARSRLRRLRDVEAGCRPQVVSDIDLQALGFARHRRMSVSCLAPGRVRQGVRCGLAYIALPEGAASSRSTRDGAV